MRRVKYYPSPKFASEYDLENAENIFQNHVEELEYKDINDIIELYNIEKYFNNKLYLMAWSTEDIEKYSIIVKSFSKKIAMYIQKVNDNNFIEEYKKVERNYYNDFWELIIKYKVYMKISGEIFKTFLNDANPYLEQLLSYKKIVDHFGQEIRSYLVDFPNTARLLLSEYELENNNHIYFPKELSNSDKEQILCDYIDSDKPNLNYLELISNLQSNRDRILVTSKTLFKAKKRSELETKKLLDKDTGVIKSTITFNVGFLESQNEGALSTFVGQKLSFSYSLKWIKNNLDYPTLLNNFIYLFEFVDEDARIYLVNKPNEVGIFEKLFMTKSKYAYKNGSSFEYKNKISCLQITGYYKILSELNIRLEEVVEWFFCEYLNNEFNASGFRILMPSVHTNFLEKSTLIMPAIEGILKQFIMFAKDKEIIYELLDIKSEHLIYEKIPSLIKKKYVYGIGDLFFNVIYLLFSDQTGLNLYEGMDDSYDNLFEVINKEKITMENCLPYQKNKIDWLIGNDFLTIDQDKTIVFSDKKIIIILKDLYYNEVISYWKYPEEYRKSMDVLFEKKIIEFEDTLFSRPEQNYINYFLNKSQYNNGLDLRNMYSHSQPYGNENMKIHEQNYMYFLRLLILFIIKINDDFCLADTIKEIKADDSEKGGQNKDDNS